MSSEDPGHDDPADQSLYATSESDSTGDLPLNSDSGRVATTNVRRNYHDDPRASMVWGARITSVRTRAVAFFTLLTLVTGGGLAWLIWLSQPTKHSSAIPISQGTQAPVTLPSSEGATPSTGDAYFSKPPPSAR